MTDNPSLVAIGGVAVVSLFHALRWFTLIMWGTLAVRLTLPAARVITRHVRQHDFLYLIIWGTAINRLWRWVHDIKFGEAANGWLAFYWLIIWYAFAILVGYGFHVIRAVYGDGEVV